LSERANDQPDTKITASVLDQAAKEIDDSQESEFEFLPNGHMKVHTSEDGEPEKKPQ
jgi:hypothetical protein